MKIKNICLRVITHGIPLGLMAGLCLQSASVLAQGTVKETLYLFHGNGGLAEVFKDNESLYQQHWTVTSERVQKSGSDTPSRLLMDGIPSRQTPRGVDLFSSGMQLTPRGLYHQPTDTTPNAGVR